MAFRRDSPGISALSGQMAFSAVKWVFKRKIDRGQLIIPLHLIYLFVETRRKPTTRYFSRLDESPLIFKVDLIMMTVHKYLLFCYANRPQISGSIQSITRGKARKGKKYSISCRYRNGDNLWQFDTFDDSECFYFKLSYLPYSQYTPPFVRFSWLRQYISYTILAIIWNFTHSPLAYQAHTLYIPPAIKLPSNY